MNQGWKCALLIATIMEDRQKTFQPYETQVKFYMKVAYMAKKQVPCLSASAFVTCLGTSRLLEGSY